MAVVSTEDVAISVARLSALEVSEEDTNNYTYLPFAWNYTNTVDRFRLYYGKAPRTYTAFIDLGTTNSYDFVKTNWVEQLDRHWYTVTAFRMGLESGYGNEVHSPLFPPNHFRLSWKNPAPITLIAHTNLSIPRERWPVLKITTQGTTNYADWMPTDVFYVDGYRTNGSPELIKIEGFNPLNDP